MTSSSNEQPSTGNCPLAGLVRRTNVAFEIDGFAEETKSGWSVLIRGFAEATPHNYLLTSAWNSGPALGGRDPQRVHRDQAKQDQQPHCAVLHTMIRSSQ